MLSNKQQPEIDKSFFSDKLNNINRKLEKHLQLLAVIYRLRFLFIEGVISSQDVTVGHVRLKKPMVA